MQIIFSTRLEQCFSTSGLFLMVRQTALILFKSISLKNQPYQLHNNGNNLKDHFNSIEGLQETKKNFKMCMGWAAVLPKLRTAGLENKKWSKRNRKKWKRNIFLREAFLLILHPQSFCVIYYTWSCYLSLSLSPILFCKWILFFFANLETILVRVRCSF